MNLVVLVLGAFAAAAGVRLVAGELSWRTSLATVAGVLGVMTVAWQAWSQARTLLNQRSASAAFTDAQHREGVGARFGANEGILRVVDEQVPRRARVLLICPNCSGELSQWITYRLTPRPFVDRAEDAEWFFTYDARPSQGGVREGDVAQVRTISPGFELGRLR